MGVQLRKAGAPPSTPQQQTRKCEVCKEAVPRDKVVKAEIIGRERHVCKPCHSHLRDAY